jgi:hypothetical protein
MPDRPTPDASAPGAARLADRARLALAWTIVGAPALWAVAQVVEKTLALFR